MNILGIRNATATIDLNWSELTILQLLLQRQLNIDKKDSEPLRATMKMMKAGMLSARKMIEEEE